MGQYAHIEYFPDGCSATVSHDFSSWDLTLPGGMHVRGQSSSLEDAKSAISAARKTYILGQWDHGKGVGDDRYVVPLRPIRR